MEKNIVGFWGYPDPEIIKNVKLEYPNAEWVDLDVDFNAEDKYILPIKRWPTYPPSQAK